MSIEFDWDPEKADSNQRKHGVSFNEAATAFGDPLGRMVSDPDHSTNEDRYVLFGRSDDGRHLAVMHTERGRTIRIISARLMTRRERRDFEERAF